ncbi:MAG TPA: copper resistance protein B [Steroidobacteraceae bacterium]|nr:copper resistance protein B [Steroidobacteraceae bacterium]
MRRACLAVIMVALAARAFGDEPGQSEREHVPPDPPRSGVHVMPYHEMADMMGMDDRKRFGKVMLDRLEWRDADTSIYEWEAAAWYGGDFSKLWVETEGEQVDGSTEHARVEVLWDRIATAWWSTRLGMRWDVGESPTQGWLAVGFAGLAPGFVELEAMAYVGDGGRTALRLSTEYDLLLTQRLVLQPQLEINAYGQDDPERLIGAGLSDLELGLRLRYEFRREVAPYVGVSWSKAFGDSADLVRQAGEDPDEFSLVAGVRLWF